MALLLAEAFAALVSSCRFLALFAIARALQGALKETVTEHLHMY